MDLEDENLEETWEEKYYKADAQLQKFRSQAGKVRELLGKKVNIANFYLCFLMNVN